MATYSRELEEQMQQYIDSTQPASLQFRKLLQLTTAEIRYKLLMEVKGERYGSMTGVCSAAHVRDLPALKCMLDGMSKQEEFNILEIAECNRMTPLHIAVYEHSGNPYCSEIAKELTNNLSTQQLYQLLEMKTKPSEHTVLHFAVSNNRADFVPRILTQLTLDQKYKLLSIRNAAGATPADLSVPTIFSTVQGLREAQQTIDRVIGELVKQGTVQSQLSDRCKELEAERVQELKETKKALVDLQTTSDVEKEKLQKTIQQIEQKVLKQTEELKQAHENVKALQEEFTEQKELQIQVVARCTELERQKVQQEEVIAEQMRELGEQRMDIQVMSARQAAMEQMLERLELEFRRPIVTDETGDQENEDY